jgi:hypothetical protein
MQTFAPAIEAPDPTYMSEEHPTRASEFDNSLAKSGGGDVGASSSAKPDSVSPHARFFINKSKSSAAIKFDPPV